MSFFRRESEDPFPGPTSRAPVGRPGAQSSSGRERPVTRIAEGTRVTGEISGPTELHVEGELEGQIRLEGRVVVGQGGIVKGQVTARSVLIAGAVEGDVRGSERVEVGASGKLEGDIAAPRVTIAEGAFFKGKVEMGGASAGQRGGSSSPAASSKAPGEPQSPGLFPETTEGDGTPGGGAQ